MKYRLDSTKINEVLYEFANDVPADIYVMAHTTAPFISESSIYSGINGVISGDNDSAFSVLKVQDFFWKDAKPLNYNLNDIPRTQDLEIMYKETSGFYIYKRELILSRMRRIGYNPLMVEVNEIEAIDIDEPEDFKVADAIYNNIIKRN